MRRTRLARHYLYLRHIHLRRVLKGHKNLSPHTVPGNKRQAYKLAIAIGSVAFIDKFNGTSAIKIALWLALFYAAARIVCSFCDTDFIVMSLRKSVTQHFPLKCISPSILNLCFKCDRKSVRPDRAELFLH